MSDVWIVDFGSQYTQLITRRSRELGYSSLILTFEQVIEKLNANESPLAFILSGGPQSVFEDQEDYSLIMNSKRPILGICYGMQLMGQFFGGEVERGVKGEYGHANVHFVNHYSFPNIEAKEFNVWMSHFDHLKTPPKDFDVILESKNSMIAGIESKNKKMMALQFHPEVNHTEFGREILQHFFHDIAKVEKNWSSQIMLEQCLDEVKEIGDKKVLCAFSGGVDSLVAASLASKVIGENLFCFFVDNGLLRPQDIDHIEELKNKSGLNIEILDVKDEFLNNLKGVSDPEAKRKIIGKTFIDVFEKQVHRFEKDHQISFEYLLQGTLYPDVIESISPHKKGGKSATIKSHHNVGGLPERMNLTLLEPLKFLFKDEVRELGLKLNLQKQWVYRHPFPGPGIGVRVLGELTEESIQKVQASDQILFEELKSQNQYDNCW